VAFLSETQFSCHIVYQGGHKVGEKIPEFSSLFESHNYTFPEVITRKIVAIWQHLWRLQPYFHRACAEMAILTDIYWEGWLAIP